MAAGNAAHRQRLTRWQFPMHGCGAQPTIDPFMGGSGGGFRFVRDQHGSFVITKEMRVNCRNDSDAGRFPRAEATSGASHSPGRDPRQWTKRRVSDSFPANAPPHGQPHS